MGIDSLDVALISTIGWAVSEYLGSSKRFKANNAAQIIAQLLKFIFRRK